LNDPLLDETACVFAKGAPEMGESGAYNPIEISCTKKEPAECKIREFWDRHRVELDILAKMDIGSISAKPKDTRELERIKEHATEIMSGKSAHGQRCTTHLSDAVICVESKHCPESVAVHSINKKHFRPLCEILGIDSEATD